MADYVSMKDNYIGQQSRLHTYIPYLGSHSRLLVDITDQTGTKDYMTKSRPQT